MRTKDWKPKNNARILVIGEEPNLQWTETLPEYPLFADYYFRKIPYDLGERSRYTEAKQLFDMVKSLTDFTYQVDEVYITCLCNEELEHAPKGKRTLIPEKYAQKGIDHIEWILEQNPEIDLIFVCSMQANYWMQKLGMVVPDEAFLKGAEPRRTGLESIIPFYQPVDGKSFIPVCAHFTQLAKQNIRVLPLLNPREYPLKDRNLALYGDAYENVRNSFKQVK